ncbi:hypothetical protein SLEP1_g17424 [Rubroshorea leprosula]|uniref:Cytochrome P450 n=1 Tax=Rubroshorea leprosula TaxID=152421 RepID=A0AAV5IU91_9ROSI|nr:hypothetical protein SLEP1_g17424 [Rubroshorea leprosula]
MIDENNVFVPDPVADPFWPPGSEKRLKIATFDIRDFEEHWEKQELKDKSSLESVDLLSRFLSSGHSNENFVTDIVIRFILADRDTTSTALTWFFWLISQQLEVELEILKEIQEKSNSPIFKEVKDMVYTHACLYETMRLYPPVPVNGKVAMGADVLADGTEVRKGIGVAYHPYAKG